MKIHLLKMLFVSLCFILLIAGRSNAQTIYFNCGDESSDFGIGASLQELFDGGSLQVEDKLFTNWSLYSSSIWGDAVAVDHSNIEVIGLDDQLFNTGIRFTSNNEWNIADNLETTGGGGLNDFFYYDVDVLDPLLRITDASIEMVIGQDNTSPGGVGLNETIWGSDNFGISGPFVYMGNFFDQVDFSDEPQTSILTYTHIQVSTGGTGSATGGVGDLEYYDARYSQTPVPEPATMLLFGIGLLGLAGVSRKKK